MLPVKRFAVAKTRLALPADERERIAAAMASDTVAAALATPSVVRVVVVTDEPAAARALARLGAEVVPDQPDAGLNQALAHGIAHARGSGAGAVATLSADLPAITPDALAAALALVAPSGVVADRAGSGTTLLAAVSGEALVPEYGDGSLRRHVASGARDLSDLVDQRLRLDVDTVADLEAALRLGVGPATRAASRRPGPGET